MGHRSVSQYKEYTECGYRYYLKRVVGVPEAPSIWTHAGTAFHEVAEDINHTAHAAGLDGLNEADDWRGLFEHRLADLVHQESRDRNIPVAKFRTSGREPNPKTYDWWMTNGPDMVDQFINWRQSNPDMHVLELPDGTPAIECEIRVQLGTVELLGYIDVVYGGHERVGTLLADLKTGSEPKEHWQLTTYGPALEMQHGITAEYGAYYLAVKGSLSTRRKLGATPLPAITEAYERMDQAEKAGVYLPVIGEHCKRCPVASACQFQGGKIPTELETET